MSKPKIVCLCGSTKFKAAFELVNKEETLQGYIVLFVGFFMHSDDTMTITDEVEQQLDKLHFEKIKLADEVIFLNVDGYVGSSTFNELKYACSLDKPIRFLEPNNIPLKCRDVINTAK